MRPSAVTSGPSPDSTALPPVPADGVPGRSVTSDDVRARVERRVLRVSLAVAVATPLVAAFDVALPGRTLLALAFTLLVPGVPLASLLRVPAPLLASSLAGAISIAIALLSATLQVLTGWWDPVAFAAALGAGSVAATVWALTRLPLVTTSAAPARRGVPTPLAGTRWARRTAWDRRASVGLLVAALAAWWLATVQVDLDDAGSLGVIGVVGWSYVLAVVLVAVVAAYQLLRPTLDVAVLATTAVVSTVVVYAFTNVADGEAGVSAGWLHVGFIQFIGEQHATFAGLDARAYWPGFFAAGAQLVRLAGTPDASSFLSLAPAFYNAAAIAPLLVIARCVTRSRRLAWLSVFVYLAANWFQQDYFSPQATAFLLYLVTVALLLWVVSSSHTPATTGSWPARVRQAVRRRPALAPGVTARQSLLWEGALLLLAGAVVVTHQLTPVTLVLALLTFVVTGHTRHRRLWLLVSLLFLAWFAWRATDFWIGHLSTVIGDLGRPGSNLTSGVSARVAGDPTYQLMQKVRLGWSLLYALTGMVGWWLVRHRREAPVVAGLVVCAGALVAFGSYGGEVVLRSFMFAAPLLAPLSAVALRGLVRRRGLVATAVLAGALVVAGLVVTATRGVNVAFERVTADDVSAAGAVYARMSPGDVVGSLQSTGALGASDVGVWVPLEMSEGGCGVPALECAVRETPEFVMVSRTQDAMGALRSGEPAGWTTAVADELVARGLYVEVYRGDDARVLQLAPGRG